MTIPSAWGRFAPAQADESTFGPKEASGTQSQENGDVIPSTQLRDTTVTKQEGHVAKPWAHLVAGGSVVSRNTYPLD